MIGWTVGIIISVCSILSKIWSYERTVTSLLILKINPLLYIDKFHHRWNTFTIIHPETALILPSHTQQCTKKRKKPPLRHSLGTHKNIDSTSSRRKDADRPADTQLPLICLYALSLRTYILYTHAFQPLVDRIHIHIHAESSRDATLGRRSIIHPRCRRRRCRPGRSYQRDNGGDEVRDRENSLVL